MHQHDLPMGDKKVIRRRTVLGAAAVGAAGLGLTGVVGTAAAQSAGFVDPPHIPGWAEGFRFGVANSGFQVEGANRDSNWKRYTDRSAATGAVDPVRHAVDFRHRYGEDIGLAAAMGVNTFRFGIEWARVQPRRGEFSESALRYYDSVIAEIRAAGMSPMITLVHFVYPGWVADQGGFGNPRTVDDFARYARLITERYADACSMWITINEPLVFFAHEVEIGALSPLDLTPFFDNLVAAHRAAYEITHESNPTAKVAANEAFLPAVAAATDELFFARVAEDLDFVGIDYYYSAAASNLTSIYGATSDFAKIRPQPDDIYQACHHFADTFPGLPIYIVENGMPTDDGRPRPDGYTRGQFIGDTLFWLQRARGEGLPLVGYNHWSITDNYEWGRYDSRFGLYRVDVLADPSLTRHPTTGVAAYRNLIASGGPPADYRPTLDPAVGSFARIPQSLQSPSRVAGPRSRL